MERPKLTGSWSLVADSSPHPSAQTAPLGTASRFLLGGTMFGASHSLLSFWILRRHSGPTTKTALGPKPSPFSCCLPVRQALASLRPGQAQHQHHTSHFRKPGVPGRVSLAPPLSHTRVLDSRGLVFFTWKVEKAIPRSLGLWG